MTATLDVRGGNPHGCLPSMGRWARGKGGGVSKPRGREIPNGAPRNPVAFANLGPRRSCCRLVKVSMRFAADRETLTAELGWSLTAVADDDVLLK